VFSLAIMPDSNLATMAQASPTGIRVIGISVRLTTLANAQGPTGKS
jgi:hypothetical protein